MKMYNNYLDSKRIEIGGNGKFRDLWETIPYNQFSHGEHISGGCSIKCGVSSILNNTQDTIIRVVW